MYDGALDGVVAGLCSVNTEQAAPGVSNQLGMNCSAAWPQAGKIKRWPPKILNATCSCKSPHGLKLRLKKNASVTKDSLIALLQVARVECWQQCRRT